MSIDSASVARQPVKMAPSRVSSCSRKFDYSGAVCVSRCAFVSDGPSVCATSSSSSGLGRYELLFGSLTEKFSSDFQGQFHPTYCGNLALEGQEEADLNSAVGRGCGCGLVWGRVLLTRTGTQPWQRFGFGYLSHPCDCLLVAAICVYTFFRKAVTTSEADRYDQARRHRRSRRYWPATTLPISFPMSPNDRRAFTLHWWSVSAGEIVRLVYATSCPGDQERRGLVDNPNGEARGRNLRPERVEML